MRHDGPRGAHLESHRGLVRVLEFQELGDLDGEWPWMEGLVSRSSAMLAEHGKPGKRSSNIRRKPSSCGSISTDMVVVSSTEAYGESADAVAWPFNDRSGSGLWMGGG